MAAIILAVLTLLFGLLSLPRWQAWIALAVSGYAFYLLFFTRLLRHQLIKPFERK
jgi:hypothetical protein